MSRIVSALGALLLWAGLLAESRAAPAPWPAKERPNVVLVMADDLGYGDLSCMGNPCIETPALDAMAARSVRFERFYVSPVCAPTRASLLTGRSNLRTRAIDTYIGRAMMDPDETTLAEILHDHGYATGIFGKWHLGDCYPLRAMDQGFEEAWVIRGGGIGQPSDPPAGRGKYTDPVLFHQGVETPTKGYCTDVYFDRAFAFLDRCAEESRPFFVYLPTNAPHGPYHDVPTDLYEELREKDLSIERFPDTGYPLPERIDTDRLARTFAMAENVDQNVARLFEKLDALGLRDDTLVIFLSDNGPEGRRYTAGLHGAKSEVYEGGVRTVAFFEAPGHFAGNRDVPQIAAHLDVLPTVLDFCGIEAPPDRPLDGRSLLPLLRGEPERFDAERRIVIQSHRGDAPVRGHQFLVVGPRYKLLHASGFGRETFDGPARYELFDLLADPFEQHDLSAAEPEILEDYLATYERWFDDVTTSRENPYDPPRIVVGSEHENPTWLTRQDWRHEAGRPWAGTSNGVWWLEVERARDFEVVLHLHDPPKETVGQARSAVLEVQGERHEVAIPEGASACTLRVSLEAGPAFLRAIVKEGEVEVGPFQVELRALGRS